MSARNDKFTDADSSFLNAAMQLWAGLFENLYLDPELSLVLYSQILKF